jgi:DNA-binding response OmpR family regulator
VQELLRQFPLDLLERILSELREDTLLALDGTQLLLSSSQQGFVDIQSGYESLLSCLSDLKSLVDLAQARFPSRAIPFDLGSLVRALESSCAPLAGALAVNLRSVVDESLDPHRLGEPEAIRTILRQLMSVALRVGASSIRLSVESGQNDDVLFVVSSVGRGMLPKSREELLGPPALESETLGLKLTLVRLLTKKINARLEFRGDDLSLSIPLPKSNPRSQPDLKPSTACDLRGKRVLLLELHPLVQRLLEKSLSDYGIVSVSGSGPGEGAVDAVILEMGAMPEDLAGQVAQVRKRFADAPILVLASNPQRNDATLCQQLGCRAFLSRPFLQEQLLLALESVLDRPSTVLLTKHSLVEATPHRARVGINDANVTSRIITARQIARIGHLPIELPSAETARRAVEEGEVDLLLCELGQDRESGIGLAQSIRSAGAPGNATPLVALLLPVEEESHPELFEAGFTDFLTTPLSLEDLSRKIMHWGGRQVSPGGGRQPAVSESRPSVDLEVLRRSSMNDLEFERELIEVFLQEAKFQLETLGRDGNPKSAHNLKGSAKVVGAIALAELLTRLERGFEPAVFEETERELERVSAWMNAHYRETIT